MVKRESEASEVRRGIDDPHVFISLVTSLYPLVNPVTYLLRGEAIHH